MIAVPDDGAPLGLTADGFPNEDKMALHFAAIVKERMGPTSSMGTRGREGARAGAGGAVIKWFGWSTNIAIGDLASSVTVVDAHKFP